MAQGHRHGSKHDRLWIRFPLDEIKYFIFQFLCSDVELMPPEFGGKWSAYPATWGIQREIEKK